MRKGVNRCLLALGDSRTRRGLGAAGEIVRSSPGRAGHGERAEQRCYGSRISREVENGKTTYEVQMTTNGHGKDISMDQKGTVIEVEEEVRLDDTPSSAKSAIEKAAGGGKILKVESVVHGATVVAYEAQVQRGSKRSEVRVSPEGKPAPE